MIQQLFKFNKHNCIIEFNDFDITTCDNGTFKLQALLRHYGSVFQVNLNFDKQFDKFEFDQSKLPINIGGKLLFEIKIFKKLQKTLKSYLIK